jgi:LysM repeat protein
MRGWTGRYTVHAGDSLSELAHHFGVSLHALAAVNGLDWRKPLLIGVVLRVPSGGSSDSGWKGLYVVHPGDSLSVIALRFHLSLSQLATANGLDPSGILFAGARLRVPAVGGSTLDLARVSETDPYLHGAVGYDVSYPNCAVPAPASQSLGVIGLNAGRPFTANPCFASEWAGAPGQGSVYLNTAYGRSLLRRITPQCAAAGRGQPLGTAAQRAYAVGCSEAVAAQQLLATVSPVAIWLDVEPANTWSSRRSLNVAAITGILDHLLTQSPHPLIGIYSNARFWHRITGGWSTLSVPEWIATGAPDAPGCPQGFAAGPVWLSQSTDGKHDQDTAC